MYDALLSILSLHEMWLTAMVVDYIIHTSPRKTFKDIRKVIKFGKIATQ